MVTLFSLVDAAFAATVLALVTLHLLVYLAPAALVRFNALPWAFRFEFNTDLDFQTVTYGVVHETAFARLSHLTIPLELLAWALLLAAWHPASLAACTALLAVLFARWDERPFRAVAMAVWLAVAALALALSRAASVDAWLLGARALLLVGPALRFFGHTVEPIPPWVGAERDAFVPYRDARVGWRTPAVAFCGWLSECAASLPFRLFWVQLFWLVQRVGYRPRAVPPWSETAALGARVRVGGWGAYPKTAALFAVMKPRVTR